ncbi:hypothetical protein LLG95_03230 [bacterium]|nr:hypothetical protein [bacterium]
MTSRARAIFVLNLIVWALIAFTGGLLKIWIRPDEGYLLMGLLIALCFTFVSVIDLFSRNDS